MPIELVKVVQRAIKISLQFFVTESDRKKSIIYVHLVINLIHKIRLFNV